MTTASDTAYDFGSEPHDGPSNSRSGRPIAAAQGKFVRVAIICAFFAALFIIASAAGVQSMIEAARRKVEEQHESRRVSHVVYTMPDKTFCRHVSFDNVSGRIKEEGVRLCDPNASGQGGGFTWGKK